MKRRFSEEQIIGFLREADAGMPVKELCRKHGFSEASYYLWKTKFGGRDVSDAKRLKALEVENAKLKKLLAEALLEKKVTREVLRKKYVSAPLLPGRGAPHDNPESFRTLGAGGRADECQQFPLPTRSRSQ